MGLGLGLGFGSGFGLELGLRVRPDLVPAVDAIVVWDEDAQQCAVQLARLVRVGVRVGVRVRVRVRVMVRVRVRVRVRVSVRVRVQVRVNHLGGIGRVDPPEAAWALGPGGGLARLLLHRLALHSLRRLLRGGVG